MSRILFAAKHSCTTLSRGRLLFAGSFFAGHVVGFSTNEKEVKFALNDT